MLGSLHAGKNELLIRRKLMGLNMKSREVILGGVFLLLLGLGTSNRGESSEAKDTIKNADLMVEELDLFSGEGAAVNIPGVENSGQEEVKTERKERGIAVENPPKKMPDLEIIRSVLKKYQTSRAVGMKVEKEVHLVLLDEIKSSKGYLWLSKGRFKMEMEKPENSLLLMEDENVWMVTKFSENEGTPVQVTKLKARQVRKSNPLIAVLFGDDSVWKKLKVSSSVYEKGFLTVEMEALKEAQLVDVTKLKLVIQKEKSEIREISYWDELENETSYKFSGVEFGKKVSSRFFRYVPPRNAEVTEL